MCHTLWSHVSECFLFVFFCVAFCLPSNAPFIRFVLFAFLQTARNVYARTIRRSSCKVILNLDREYSTATNNSHLTVKQLNELFAAPANIVALLIGLLNRILKWQRVAFENDNYLAWNFCNHFWSDLQQTRGSWQQKFNNDSAPRQNTAADGKILKSIFVWTVVCSPWYLPKIHRHFPHFSTSTIRFLSLVFVNAKKSCLFYLIFNIKSSFRFKTTNRIISIAVELVY